MTVDPEKTNTLFSVPPEPSCAHGEVPTRKLTSEAARGSVWLIENPNPELRFNKGERSFKKNEQTNRKPPAILDPLGKQMR